MDDYKIKLIQSGAVIILFLLLKFVINKLIRKVSIKFRYHKPRIKIISKLISLILFSIALGFLFIVWGIDKSDLFLFISSLLTIVGIAFVAQWSLLSNITSTIIIFFSHPIRIGEQITILDKDYHIEGRISDIRVFFIIIKTTEGEYVTIPSSVFMQKMIKRNKGNQ